MHAPIFIATVIDVILEPQFELFKFLIIIQIIIIQNPELEYCFIYFTQSNLYHIGYKALQNLLDSKMVGQQSAIE